MAQLGEQAAFLSAGGYRHHVGANTWESAGAPPAPEGMAALLHATIVLPGAAERDRVSSGCASRATASKETEDGPRVRGRLGTSRSRRCLDVDGDLEAAVAHALGVEGHVLHICRPHHVGQAWIFHHLRIDAIAVTRDL